MTIRITIIVQLGHSFKQVWPINWVNVMIVCVFPLCKLRFKGVLWLVSVENLDLKVCYD